VAMQVVLTASGSQPAQTTKWQAKTIHHLLEYAPGGNVWWSVGAWITITTGPTGAWSMLTLAGFAGLCQQAGYIRSHQPVLDGAHLPLPPLSHTCPLLKALRGQVQPFQSGPTAARQAHMALPGQEPSLQNRPRTGPPRSPAGHTVTPVDGNRVCCQSPTYRECFQGRR
jgi:hypothetical protein